MIGKVNGAQINWVLPGNMWKIAKDNKRKAEVPLTLFFFFFFKVTECRNSSEIIFPLLYSFTEQYFLSAWGFYPRL